MNCLFCAILAHDVPADILYEDEHLAVIQDVNPQAPTHVLVIPRKHIATLNDLRPDDDALVGEMFRRSAAVAVERGIAASRLSHRLQLQPPGRPDGLPHPLARDWRPPSRLAAGLASRRRTGGADSRRVARRPCAGCPADRSGFSPARGGLEATAARTPSSCPSPNSKTSQPPGSSASVAAASSSLMIARPSVPPSSAETRFVLADLGRERREVSGRDVGRVRHDQAERPAAPIEQRGPLEPDAAGDAVTARRCARRRRARRPRRRWRACAPREARARARSPGSPLPVPTSASESGAERVRAPRHASASSTIISVSGRGVSTLASHPELAGPRTRDGRGSARSAPGARAARRAARTPAPRYRPGSSSRCARNRARSHPASASRTSSSASIAASPGSMPAATRRADPHAASCRGVGCGGRSGRIGVRRPPWLPSASRSGSAWRSARSARRESPFSTLTSWCVVKLMRWSVMRFCGKL